MIELEASAGEHISGFAKRLTEAAKVAGARGTFNGVALRVDCFSTVDEVCSSYSRQMEAAAVAYRNSPEGIAAERKREASIQAAQDTHDALVRDLASLDFKNDVAVLDWLCAIQDATDHSGVAVNKATILDTFSRHGFAANVNCGADYKPDDRDNAFRYLVGQAMDGLQSVAIHGIIHKFAVDWKAKFVS